MSLESVIQATIEKVIKLQLPLIITEGTVTKVDKTANTCNVDRGENAELLNVRLNSILEAGTEVMTIYPTEGSSVLCVVIENDETDAFILSTNKIDEIIYNAGENGGLIKINELVAKLNELSDKYNDLIDRLLGWVPASGDGGAALKNALTLPSPVEKNEDFKSTDFENPKFKH